jgi:hypothetical protein
MILHYQCRVVASAFALESSVVVPKDLQLELTCRRICERYPKEQFCSLSIHLAPSRRLWESPTLPSYTSGTDTLCHPTLSSVCLASEITCETGGQCASNRQEGLTNFATTLLAKSI